MNIDTEIQSLKGQIKTIRERIKFLTSRKKILKKLPEGSFCGHSLDFDGMNHAQVIQVIKHLGGKWRKSETLSSNPEHKGRIDYVAQIDGVQVRCWAGEPPPSCRLIEVEEHVPEQVIPAHTRKIKKMICSGKDEPLVVALARAQTQ